MRILSYAPVPEPEALTHALAERGHQLLFAFPAVYDGPEPTTVSMLAAHLVDTEKCLSDDTDTVLLGAKAGDDWVLAAAIGADKLQLPSLRVLIDGDEDHLLSLIVPDSITAGGAEETASEIAAWAEALPTLPAR